MFCPKLHQIFLKEGHQTEVKILQMPASPAAMLGQTARPNPSAHRTTQRPKREGPPVCDSPRQSPRRETAKNRHQEFETMCYWTRKSRDSHSISVAFVSSSMILSNGNKRTRAQEGRQNMSFMGASIGFPMTSHVFPIESDLCFDK